MSIYSASRRPHATTQLLLLQILAALLGGVLLFCTLVLIIITAFNIYYAGRVYPGVSVAGVNLAGLAPDKASVALAQNLTYPQSGKIVLQDGEQVWMASPAELGLSFDPKFNAQSAYQYGRSGNPFTRLSAQVQARYSGTDLPALLVYDERAASQYLNEIAAQVDQPTIEASLDINGLDVVAIPGQIGRSVDIQANLDSLQEQMHSLTDGVLPLKVVESPPQILDVSQGAETARQILSQPLTLKVPDDVNNDPGPWVVPPDQLAEMITIERVQSEGGSTYRVALSEDALYTYMTALTADVDRSPANARFIFNDDTRLLEVIQPAVIGRNLDIYSTIQDINQRLLDGKHTTPLRLVYSQPEIGDKTTGEELGITELISSHTSYFRGSSTERLQNIEIAAANFHGLLVPPGAPFSMASAMGDVSLDTGYAEAWIIFGGRTIKGVGGGVCQVSTTLFRTAFFAGFPIQERHPHAYRVGYYEQTYSGYDANMAGLDATVFVPMVDFKFVNDTPYWLLMETYFNPTSRSLTWKFYSTSDGRSVEWESTGPQNVVDPPDPVYEENPELAQGVIKQVDWAAEGADVSVTRSVFRNGEVLFSDIFNTHYMPWGDVYEYGPGTKLPKKKKKPVIINP